MNANRLKKFRKSNTYIDRLWFKLRAKIINRVNNEID